MVLPGDVGVAAKRRDGRTWIVGGRPGRATQRIARRFGARPILRSAGIYVVDIRRARPFASALRAAGRLSLAEPNALARKRSFPSDPLTPAQYWLPKIVHPSLTPPPVTSQSPILGIADDQMDVTHPDLSVGGNFNTTNEPLTTNHGTAAAGAAAAPANGTGIVGVWPGARVAFAPNDEGSCGNVVGALDRLIEAEVAVINMSYGFPYPGCFSHLVATQGAFAAGIVLVAAGGNEFEDGNKVERPAGDPHVVTVAATDADDDSAAFSTESVYNDISAPGARVLTTVPVSKDEDGNPDGYEALDGTSFAAPMVAAAATWLAAVRPSFSNDQLVNVLRGTARDLGSRGRDVVFGSGLLDLRRALGARAPAVDPLEPNDDVEWVNGRRFDRPDAPIWAPGNGLRRVSATTDRAEDPADVYRVVFPPRATLSFRLFPGSGDPDIDVHRRFAGTVRSERHLIAYSNRSGRAVDGVTLTNAGRGNVLVYVNVYVDRNVRALGARYRLEVQRVRFQGRARRVG